MEMIVTDKHLETLLAKLRAVALKRGKGAMDPIWDDITEITCHLNGSKTMFNRQEAATLAVKWLVT